MDLVEVGTAVCGGEQLLTLYCGRICVWPDPWTNLWDEGYPLTWENGWRDLWSLDSAPPAVEEV